MECAYSTEEQTPYQASELRRLTEVVRRSVDHMRQIQPYEPAWKVFQRDWNGLVMPGHTPNRAEYSNGCLTMGIPKTYVVDPAILNARILLGVSKAATNNKVCTDLHSALLTAASGSLGIPVAIECGDAQTSGLSSPTSCPTCQWKDAELCHTKRFVWPELVGLHILRVMQIIPKHLKIEAGTWDSLHYRPAKPDTVRVTYDARTGIVVHPAPHLGNVNVPQPDGNCFALPDAESTAACIGAPVPPSPANWTAFIGRYITDAVDAMRVRYPHAVIEPLPMEAGVSSDLRPDRIRIRFNPETGRVASLPTVG